MAPLPARPVAAPLPLETAAVPPPPPPAARASEAAGAPDASRTRAASRLARRDYAYVIRDIQRIIILSVLIIIAIVVLSFFLP
jgi:hypothetical protein